MGERDRSIRGFSDKELLKFHAQGGHVPLGVRPRLEALLEKVSARHEHELRFGADAALPYVPRTPEQIAKRAEERRIYRARKKLRVYALENLIGRRLPARKTA